MEELHKDRPVHEIEQYLLEYGGFSLSRGRCHVVLDRALDSALVGDPPDNPGTSVTKAVEQVGYELKRSLDLDVRAGAGRLYQYVPWDPDVRHERTLLVEFKADAWSM